MVNGIKKFINRAKELDRLYNENIHDVCENNLKFYKLFDYMMIVLLGALFMSTLQWDYAGNLKPIYAIFIVVTILELFSINIVNEMKDQWIMFACYFGIVKAYAFCLLTSVVYNRDDSAITFYIFMILIPVSFSLKRNVMYVIQIVSASAFCICTYMFKEPDLYQGDIISCVMFFVISIIISTQINAVRINNLSMAAKEHKRSVEMEMQANMLSFALDGAGMSAWVFDCNNDRYIPTYISKEHRGFDVVIDNMPEAVIEHGLAHKDSVNDYRNMFNQAKNGSDFVQADVQLKPYEESDFIWFHLVLVPEKVAGNRTGRYIGISENIAERKNVELAYEEQVRVLNDANEENLISKGKWNLSKNSQEVGEEVSHDSLGFSQATSYDEAVGVLIESIFPKSKGEQIHNQLKRESLISEFNMGIDKHDFEYQRMTGNNSSIWVNMKVRVIRVPGTEEIVCFAFSYNITEEVINRNIINQLVTSEYDFLGTVDIISGKSIVRTASDEMRGLIENTGSFLSITDYSNSVMTAVEMAVIPEERNMVINELNLENVCRHLEKEDKHMVVFTTVENGEKMRKKIEYCYLDAGHETVLYYRSDITQLYNMEQEHISKLEEVLAQVEEANAAKTDFLSRMSHDMRTPMNGIIGMTRMTQEIENLPKEAYSNLNAISDSSNFLLSLINDTLDMSRIERNSVILVSESIDSKELIKNIIAIVQPLVDEKNINLSFNQKNIESHYIIADRVRLQQVMLNIISNAVKFTNEGGQISIDIECIKKEKNTVYDRITIADTGIGMSEEFLKKIFEPFSQENSRLTSRQVGSGLGMSIVKKLVELMGGTIDIKSVQGQGTTVIMDMRFEVTNNVDKTESAKDSDYDAILKGRRILLVEDHPLNLTIARSVLEKKGVDVDTASDGKEAVEKFEKSEVNFYDAVLMDIQMPVMNGLQATTAIRQLNRQDATSVIIIAMSANAFAEDIQKSKEAGMNDHISKPIEPEIVYSTLSSYLSK